MIVISTTSPSLRKRGGVEADARPRRRAGGYDVSWHQLQARRYRLNEFRNAENELARIGALPQIPDHPRLEIKVLRLNLVGGGDRRAHGAERVQRLP